MDGISIMLMPPLGAAVGVLAASGAGA